MTETPKISVVLPAYNAGKYIYAAVESLMRQTLPAFEIIVVNDGSKDDTANVVRRLQATDRAIRLIDRGNVGLVGTLNEAIDAASGDWIARMDADDIALPHRLLSQWKYVEQNEIDLCGGSMRTFGWCKPSVRRYPLSEQGVKLQLLFNTAFAHPTVFARSELLKKNRYALEGCEDYDLWTRLAIDGARMRNLPDIVLRYRRTFSQFTNRVRSTTDRIRPLVAENYRSKMGFSVSARLLQLSHDRSGSLSYNDLAEVAGFWGEEINRGHDRDGVIRENLVRIALQNAATVRTRRMRELTQILTAKQKVALAILAITRTSPVSRRWKYVLYLK